MTETPVDLDQIGLFDFLEYPHLGKYKNHLQGCSPTLYTVRSPFLGTRTPTIREHAL